MRPKIRPSLRLALPLMLGLGALAPAAPVGAATLSLTAGELVIGLGRGIPPAVVTQAPDPLSVLVSSGTGGFGLPAGLFATTSLALPTALFTGLPIISGLVLTASNATGVFQNGAGPAGGFGGAASLPGQAVAQVIGGIIQVPVPFTAVGAGGTTAVFAFELRVVLTGHIWTTGAASVTGITTTTTGGAVVNTVTLSGGDLRTPGHAGQLTLVTPIRVLTNAIGNLPGFGTLTLHFVPEPGTLVLLGAGSIALALVARRRNAEQRSSRAGPPVK